MIQIMGDSMKKILLLFIFSICITQNPIETREYRFYKDRDVNEINVFDLIKESDGLFEIKLIKINQLKYENKRRKLVAGCELEFDIESNVSKSTIKLCGDYLQSNNDLIIDRNNYGLVASSNIVFNIDKLKYLEGEFIFRISGEYKSSQAKFNKADNGILREWYDNGQLYLEFTMTNGIKDGVCKKWYDNGQIQIVYNYIKGKLNGNQKKWFSNGNLRAEWNYLNDQLHGISTEWNADGSIKSKRQYQNGQLIKEL